MTGEIIVPEREVAQMGYGFTPGAGKRSYEQPKNSRLGEVFGHWLDAVNVEAIEDECKRRHCSNRTKRGRLEDAYNFRADIRDIENIEEVGSGEVNSLILQYKTHPRISIAGMFITACYNMIGEEQVEFNFDSETPINYIGYKLSSEKTLLLKEETGKETGAESRGTIVNYSTVHGDLGEWASGRIVNFGVVESDIGQDGGGVMVLNYGSARNIRLRICGVNFSSITGAFVWKNDGLCVNMGRVNMINHLGNGGAAINFGSADSIGMQSTEIVANFGSPGTHYVKDRKFGPFYGLIMDKAPDFDGIVADTEELKKHANIMEYFERLKQGLENFRNADYPNCLGAFDFLEAEVGGKKELTEKIKALWAGV